MIGREISRRTYGTSLSFGSFLCRAGLLHVGRAPACAPFGSPSAMYSPKRSFFGAWCDTPFIKPCVRIFRIRLHVMICHFHNFVLLLGWTEKYTFPSTLAHRIFERVRKAHFSLYFQVFPALSPDLECTV